MENKETTLQYAFISKMMNESYYNEALKYLNYTDFLSNIENNNDYRALSNIIFDKKIKEAQDAHIKSIFDKFKKDDNDILLEKCDVKYLAYLKENNNMDVEKYFNEEKKSAVISIDIRKSTELMLKAKTPDDFVEFITKLVNNLIKVIEKNFGIIEKFTGDGLLAFFPEFYTGQDCCSYAINTALECHKIFDEIYHGSYDNFVALPSNTGLGIGIDYGEIILKIIRKSVNIIGRPVVYACRLGSIEAGKTAVNINVYENIMKNKKGARFYPENIDLKTNEKLLCYSVKEEINSLERPDWSK